MPSPSPVNTIWPQEKIDTLKRLWSQGDPASAIGEQMGISKNAVLGKVHKLKLPARVTKEARSNVDVPRSRLVAMRRLPIEPFDVEDNEAAVDVTHLIGIMELRPSSCRWIEGDPKQAHGYCGKKAEPKSSWCSAHSARVFRRDAP